MDGDAGKGDWYRPVNRQKYDRNYLMIFGDACPNCGGAEGRQCSICNGYGFIERTKDGQGSDVLQVRKDDN